MIWNVVFSEYNEWSTFLLKKKNADKQITTFIQTR